MAKYNSIAVLYGSDSSEWEVSCRSGEFTAARIDESLFDVYEIFARHGKWSLVAMRKRNSMRVPFPEEARPEIDKTDFSVRVLGEKVKFDFVYIMQHGSPGETGQLQGYFEMLGIPFSTCSAFVTTVAFDKYSCKSYLRGMDGVKLAPDALVRKDMDVDAFSVRAVERLGLPLFVKPTASGSSFGITRVTRAEDLPGAIRFAFSECDSVIVERGITPQHEAFQVYGDVLANAALSEEDAKAFIEEKGYGSYLSQKIPFAFDYYDQDDDATDDKSGHGTHVSGIALAYFLEVNIIPGMTNASLVPKMVRAAGMDITAFLTTIIENA